MKRFKIAVAGLVIISGIIGAYFIIGNNLRSNILEKNSIQKEISENKNILNKNPIQWLNDLSLTKIAPEQIGKSEDQFNKINKGSINLTALVADSIKNAEGKEITREEIIEKSISVIGDPSSIFNPAVNESDLKISFDNSQEAKSKYFTSIERITQNRMGDFEQSYVDVLYDVFKNKDISSAQQLAQIYQNTANDYLILTAPSDFSDLPKQLIVYFKKASMVYQSISNYQSDPMKAYLAVQVIDELKMNAEDNQKLFEQKFNEAQL